MSRVFAYCRVSTKEQTTANQVQEIAAAGFAVDERRVVEETISGSSAAAQRAGFNRLLDPLEAGDVLLVTKLDRLGRNTMDVLATVERLAGLGIRVHCLQLGGADLTSAAGKLTMTVLAAVAQFERDLLIERTNGGLERARAEGKAASRPPALDDNQVAAVREAIAGGETVAALARRYGTSRQTIMRARAAGTTGNFVAAPPPSYFPTESEFRACAASKGCKVRRRGETFAVVDADGAECRTDGLAGLAGIWQRWDEQEQGVVRLARTACGVPLWRSDGESVR